MIILGRIIRLSPMNTGRRQAYAVTPHALIIRHRGADVTSFSILGDTHGFHAYI